MFSRSIEKKLRQFFRQKVVIELMQGKQLFWLCFLIVLLVALGYPGITRSQELMGVGHTRELRYNPIVPQGNVGQISMPEPPPLPMDNTNILVSELKGVIFVDHQDLVVSPAPERFGINIDSPQLRILNNNKLQSKIQSYLGKPVSVAMLNSLARDVILFYRETDHPIVDVSVPEQDITNGVVYVVVVEAKLGDATVEGGRYFRNDRLARYVRLPQEQRISEQRVLEEMRWLNENPFRRVNVELRPGQRYGETDVAFKVQDRFPVQFYTGYDDTGTQLTSLERLSAGAIWGNAFGKDHTASYQLTGSPDFKDLVAHSGVYSIPLKNHDRFITYGSYATTDPYDKTQGIQYDGFYGEAGFIYDKKLRTKFYDKNTWYEQRASFGFQYKNMNNTLDFGIPGAMASYPVVDIGQIVLGYNSILYQKQGLWSFGANLYISPGGFTARNDDETFGIYRQGSTADYCYTRIRVERLRDLGKNFKGYLKVEGQAANRNLIATEQLGLGGFGSVRGYDTYFLSADNALLFTAEIQTAPKSFGLNRRFGIKDEDQFTGLLFYDHGIGWNNHEYSGYFKDEYLNSVGAGFRYRLAPCFNLRFDYGWQLHRDDLPIDTGNSGRAHLSVVFSR